MRASFTKPLYSCVLVHPWQLVSSSSLFSLGRSASHPTHMQPPMAVCIQQTARRAPNLAACIPQASPTALVRQSATTQPLLSGSVPSLESPRRNSPPSTPTSPGRLSACTWVVEIVLSLQGLGLLLGRQNLIEAVLAQDDQLALPAVYFVLSQQLHDLLAHC